MIKGVITRVFIIYAYEPQTLHVGDTNSSIYSTVARQCSIAFTHSGKSFGS